MNKKLLFPLLVVLLLACNIASPFTAATPITQVVFRSPRDMNLQPQDVPDLKETNVENPAAEPLLPEAIDQDQRIYISITQNIYIESYAIMVPERTHRKPREIFDEVVRKRHPKAEVVNTETPVSIGNSGSLIIINNYCASDYNAGLILIIIRDNMVIVLIGCGSDVTQDYVVRLGEIVDGHIISPPQPHEIASSDILTTTPENEIVPSDILTTTPESTVVIVTDTATTTCTDSNLTPEEKANCGTHTYEITGTITSYCSIMPVNTGTIDLTTIFSGNIMTSIHTWQFTKIATNVYEYVRGKTSPTSNVNRHVNTITLTLNGFTENYAYEGPKGELFDCWLDTYTLIR